MKRLVNLFILAIFASVSVFAQVKIQMEKEGGVYKIPCTVNGAKMKMIFDTGASNVCLSLFMANYLLENDYISINDFIGTSTSQIADGSIQEDYVVILHDIGIAGLHLKDVEALVTKSQEAPLLLGQSAIQKLGPITINGETLIINNARATNNTAPSQSEHESALTLFRRGYNYDQQKNYTEAVKCYTLAIEQGLTGKRYWPRPEKNEETVRWYTHAAEQGNPQVQLVLGIWYDIGWGVQENEAEAVKWYTLAAEKGNVEAQIRLAGCYKYGWGLQKNEAEAVKWYTLAAKQGNATAQLNLGDCYRYGEGVQENEVEAVRWYTRAAENESVSAQLNLGDYYGEERVVVAKPVIKNGFLRYSPRASIMDKRKSWGTHKNNIEAVKWYTRAAEQGDKDAQNILGYCYAHGYGVHSNYDDAEKWYTRAAEQGDEKAKRNLDNLNEKRTNEIIGAIILGIVFLFVIYVKVKNSLKKK